MIAQNSKEINMSDILLDRIKAHRSAPDVYDAPTFDDMADRIEELEANLKKAAEALEQIASHRKKCHEYDDDVGHERREFDVEDMIIMEYAARTTLAELKGQDDE